MSEKHAYDRLACIGFLEHVGEALYPAFFRQAWELVRPGGALSQSRHRLAGYQAHSSRLDFYLSLCVSRNRTGASEHDVQVAEAAGWEVRDVESLREHYALTLRHWLRRLEARAEEAHRHVDDFTYRVFRLYLAGSAFGFTIGQPSIYQSLFVKPLQGDSRQPLTRADWYA